MTVETVWFVLCGFMLAAYVVLDGFDFGVGILHLVVARTDDERRCLLRSIGPVWDGNEVWLLAAGGSLFLAFPRLLATSFSGFYLPLIMVVWLLLFRALGIEMRHQIDNVLWKRFWDVAFSGASFLLAVFFGAALGNVIRGVSMGADGRFFAPLWTNFLVGDQTGILDWYTVLVGLAATTALAVHGGLWIVWRTDADLRQRAAQAVRFAWPLALFLGLLTMAATLWVQPQVLRNVSSYPWGALFPLAGFGALAYARWALGRGAFRPAFFGSTGYLVGMLASAAFGVYPMVLPARDAALSLTVTNASGDAHGLEVALWWWVPGLCLALSYFWFLYTRMPATFSASDEDAH